MEKAIDSVGCFIGAILCLAIAQCTSIPIDKAMSAEEGREASVTLCGLGEGCHKGMLFKQIQSGSVASGIIELKMPKFDCDFESCVRFQVFMPDGSQGYSGGIRKGETSASFLLSDVLQHETVLYPDHDEEYALKVKAWYKYKDSDGDVRRDSMLSRAFIRINPVHEAYQFMGCDDPMAAWGVNLSKKEKAQYSSRFRGAKCGK